MAKIVCATRGGVGSRAVQKAAIERATASKGDLVFLYIVDTALGRDYQQDLANAVHDELQWMGRAILRVAEKRAEDSGIAADVVIREGAVADEIAAYLKESGASLLLLGAPRKEDLSTFGEEGLLRFAEQLRAAAGVAVEIVRPEPAPLG